MPHGYNEVFTLEKLLDREEYNTIGDILSEIKEVKQDLNDLSLINDKLEDFKKCLLIIHEENKELKDNLSIVLKNNEEYELKLIELEKNTRKEKLSLWQHIDKKYICILFITESVIITIIKCFSKWTVLKLYINYGLSFDNTFNWIKVLLFKFKSKSKIK